LSLKPRISAGQFLKGLGGGLEEEVVEDFLVWEDEGIQFMGEGDNHMKVMGGEKPFLSVLEPFRLG
jgi:hypothetical protein